MRAVLMGLGVTGRAVAEALVVRRHEVVAFDDRPSEDLVAWATDHDIEVSLPEGEALAHALATADVGIPAPGLPDHHPFFAAIEAAAAELISEFDLAGEWDDRPVVAVTGTDGKTTVVTLIEQMLEASGIPAAAVGNTETPWVAAIDDPRPQVFVVEASSFRLAHSRRFSPQVAVWLNFGPDHLDAHASLADYERSKAAIWTHLADDAVAVANRDDEIVMRHVDGLVHVETFGLDAGGVNCIADGHLIVAGQPLLAVTELPRSLPHDQANALAASIAALAVGATREGCADTLRSFQGLPHRVEFVLEHDGVRWFNDSKATTPHAAAAGLAGFRSVVLLAGGRNKGLALDELAEHRDRVKHVIGLGEAADEIRTVFEDLVPTSVATSMDEAITTAATVATAGDVVLLAPACASFDWYDNYKARGTDFAARVRARFGGTA